jgi:hypothetical protein
MNLMSSLPSEVGRSIELQQPASPGTSSYCSWRVLPVGDAAAPTPAKIGKGFRRGIGAESYVLPAEASTIARASAR